MTVDTHTEGPAPDPLAMFSGSQGASTLPVGTTQSVINRLFPTADPYAADPVAWVGERLRSYLWSKQREIIESVRDNRYTAVQSCHGAGKSFTAATVLAWWIDTHPVNEVFVVWTAPRWPQVKAIIGRELRAMHRRAKLPGRITLDCDWYIDETLVGYGRKPADTDEHGFQGIHAKYVLIVIDEACGVPKQLWNAVESLMTNEHCRVLAIGNPDDPASEFAQVCLDSDSDYHKIKISAFDTPNFTDEWVPEKLEPLLISKVWEKERAKRWGTDSMIYVSKVLGEFPQVSTDTLFPPRLILAMQNAELPGLGRGRFGLDVSRYGSDKTVMYRYRDGVIRFVTSWAMKATTESADLAADVLKDHWGVPINVDVIGIGSGVVDILRRKGFEAHAFNSSAKSSDPKRWANLRAEAYWQMKEDAETGDVDIDPEDLDLAADLGAIKYKIHKGKIVIEDKDDIRKRLGRSPDNADAAAICYLSGSNWAEFEKAMENVKPRADLTSDLLDKAM